MAKKGTVRVREESTQGGGSIEQILDDMEGGALINYSTEYAMYVEFPTAYSSPPPFGKIRDWVDRKWPDLSQGLKKEGGGTKDGVAKVVQWSIYENGIRGVHFGGRSLNRGKQNAPTVLASYAGSEDPEANQKALAEVANGMFEMSQRIISQEASDTGNLLQSGSIEWFDDAEDMPDPEGGGSFSP